MCAKLYLHWRTGIDYLYCLSNASLTQRVIAYLSGMGTYINCVTLFFLNDFWLLRIQFTPVISHWQRKNCLAFLTENGAPYLAPSNITQALKDLDKGYSVTDVMNEHYVVIIFHGMLQPNELRNFRQRFIARLGDCPPSLV